MRKYLIVITVLLCAIHFSNAQEKQLEFRDGKTLTIQGRLVGTIVKIQDGKVSKKVYYYFSKEGNQLKVSIYGEWENGGMDDLRVYVFTAEQLGTTGLGMVDAYEADEYHKNIRYGFSFSTDTETPFNYLEYSKWTSEGTPKSFTLISVYGEDKALIEALYAEILALIPVEKSEEE